MLTYEIPDSLKTEIDELDALIQDYKLGRIDFNELKAHRVPFGIYEQRKDDTYMVRIRCAGGMITPSQLASIAELSEKYGNEYLHLTTRQEVQIHDVVLDDIIPILRELQPMGLSSRGGGGNTIRNIMTDVYSGIHSDQVFDVTPYAVALTSQLISEPDSWRLPRKYKISFSACPADRGLATVNDLGFIAALKEGQQGFTVYIAGGMGARSELGKVLYEFVLPEEIYPIARGLKNLFDKHGNRRNKHDARIRFLWNNMGEAKFRSHLEAEIAALKQQDLPELDIPLIEDISPLDTQSAMIQINDADQALWMSRYVLAQRQTGLYAVLIPVALGNLSLKTAVLLAIYLNKFGDNVLRISQDQNLVLRNIPGQALDEVYHFIKTHFSWAQQPAVLSKLRACAGASTCKLGIGLSRGLADAINQATLRSGLDLDALQDLRVNISGCPNSCGQHMLADIGYFGRASRKDAHLYPAYHVVVGAQIGRGRTCFAEQLGSLAARDIPRFHVQVIRDYLESRLDHDSFAMYLEKRGREHIIHLLKDYANVPDFAEDKTYYYDWGSEELFSLAGRGVGECSAGIFDLIDVDVKNIEKVRLGLERAENDDVRSGLLYELVLYSSRMLLVTQGIEARDDQQVFEKYLETFINPCLVEDKFKSLILSALAQDRAALLREADLCLELSHTMVELYQNMDNSLNFHNQAQAASERQVATADKRRFKDLRGVACPMNFVKVKIELASMQKGEVLDIWLDDGQPIQNVPGSVRSEGHKVLSQEQVEDYWGVSIQKS